MRTAELRDHNAINFIHRLFVFSFAGQSKGQQPAQQSRPVQQQQQQQQRQAPVTQPAPVVVTQKPQAPPPAARRRQISYDRDSTDSSYFCEGALNHQLSTMSMRAPKAGDMFHNEMKMEKVNKPKYFTLSMRKQRMAKWMVFCRGMRRKRRWEHQQEFFSGSQRSWANKLHPQWVDLEHENVFTFPETSQHSTS